MKRTLSPNLIRENLWNDKTFPFDEHWIVLREPRDIPPHQDQEAGIGPIEIEEVAESEDSVTHLRCQWREIESALSASLGIAQDDEPHIVLTRDCFDHQGPVRLLIYSTKPFSSAHE